MYYMLLDGKLTEENWELLIKRKLILESEKEALSKDEIEKPASHVCLWAYRRKDANHGPFVPALNGQRSTPGGDRLRLVYRLHAAGRLSELQAKELRDHIGGLRGHASKQIGVQPTTDSAVLAMPARGEP